MLNLHYCLTKNGLEKRSFFQVEIRHLQSRNYCMYEKNGLCSVEYGQAVRLIKVKYY